MTLHSPILKRFILCVCYYFILRVCYYFIFDCCHMVWLLQLHKNISTCNSELQRRWKLDSRGVQHHCVTKAAETANVEMIHARTQADVFTRRWA